MTRVYADWLPRTDPLHWIGRYVQVSDDYETWYCSLNLPPFMFNGEPVLVTEIKMMGVQGLCARCQWEHTPPRPNEVIFAWIPLCFLAVRS